MSSLSLNENIKPKDSKYDCKVQQKNLDKKILRGRTVEIRHKLLKLKKATQCLNVTACILQATSLELLGESNEPKASEYEHELEQKDLEVKILSTENVAIKHKLLKLQKDTRFLKAAWGLLTEIPSASQGENVNQKTSGYERELEEKTFKWTFWEQEI